ncbi:MAG: DegV family protein [Anaerolineae bacterium]
MRKTGADSCIQVVTDSSADVPEKLAQELDITVVPVVVAFGEQVYQDGELSQDEFWRLAAGPVPPTTSQPPIGAFEEAFQRLVDRGCHVLCTTLTGRHSGTYACAWSAAQRFDGWVTVVDSLSLSLGQGWQVIAAARLAKQGANVEQILECMRSIRERTHVVIQLDTLEHLRRGGRAAALVPVIDRFMRFLNLKPLLSVVQGELKLLGVARSYHKGLERIKEEVGRLGAVEFLAVMHTRRVEVAERLADELAAITHLAREHIAVGDANSILACHAGEGLIATVAVTSPL